MLAFLIVQQRRIIGSLDSNTWAPRTRHAPNGTCAWAHATFCRRPNAMRNIKGQSRWCSPCLQGREHGEGYQYHWTQQTDMGLCWVWPLKLRKSIWIIMKLHKIQTRFKVTIVLCPSLLKISLWRSEKGHRATWRGKYQQRNQFAAIFNQCDPEWSRPRGRVSQDHSGSLILGVRIVCGTDFRPRVTQDHPGSPRSGGSDRSWNRAQVMVIALINIDLSSIRHLSI